jgi:uncharacterized membrane protein
MWKQVNKNIESYQKIIYGIMIFLSAFWVAGIFLAPLWAAETDVRGDVSDFFYFFYSKQCHQEEARSFFLDGSKYGVCSRCSFIYIAFLIGTIAYPFIRNLNNIELPSIWFLLLACLLLAVDVGLDMIQIFKNTFITRMITGSVIGVILPFYLIPGVIRIFYEFRLPPIPPQRS